MQGDCKNKQLGLYLLSIIYTLLWQGLHKYTGRQLTGLQHMTHGRSSCICWTVSKTNARLITIQWCIVGVTITQHSVCAQMLSCSVLYAAVLPVIYLVQMSCKVLNSSDTISPFSSDVFLSFDLCSWWFYLADVSLYFNHRGPNTENVIAVDVIKTLLSDCIMSATCPLGASCCDRMSWIGKCCV